MKGTPVSSGLKDIAGGIIVFPVVVVVVVVVVISAVIVINGVRGFATLFDDGKVESNDDGNGGDNNANSDRANDHLAFGFVRRSISITFLLKVSAAPAGGGGPSGKVGIVGVILVWDGRVTTGVTNYERVQRIDGR